MKHFSVFLILFLFVQFLGAQDLKSPEDFLGYKIGTEFTRHADVVEYFEHLSENSGNLQFQTYGKTNEGRSLTYAIISSEENLENLERIRMDHLRNTGIADGGPGNPNKAVVWLSYNVHGNEASSTEAAMQTSYELVSAKKEWLENTVIILDPNVNPDGRDRYVNWFNQVRARPYNKDPLAIEHHEPWPGGRPNHYLFDLNRDWAWATQVETRQRLKVYNDWLPHIHVDFHEQGITDPYYFAPAAEPFHEAITSFQRDFQTRIGKNHAKYFDEEGWLYFTKERFDLLYPSYGDTYPTFMGAIGMTYEQAGHGRAGLGIETTEGYELTLVDRVAHHHTTGLSTVEMAAANAEELNAEFREFYQNSNHKYKSYALRGDPDKISALQQLLDRHEISYGTTSTEKIRGFNYSRNDNSGFNDAGETMIIDTDQPKGNMVNVLLEPATRLSDSLTYDITAWSLPYAYGLEAVASTGKIESNAIPAASDMVNTAAPEGAGYISTWTGMQDARFLSALLLEGIKVRFSELELENQGRTFAPGSLIITKSDNRSMENFDSKLIEVANAHSRQLTAATTGFATKGPDFGSSDIRIINPPRIGVLRGPGTSSLNYGEIWYFFEQDLHYPITSVDTGYFDQAALSELDVIILPSGNYGELFKGPKLEGLKSWVRNGGKVIALGNAVAQFAGKKDFSLKENPATEKDTTAKKPLIPYDQREREKIKDLITGSIVKTHLDNTHPMAFGYGQNYFSMKLSNDSFAYLDEGFNVGYLEESPEIVSGFAGSQATEKIRNSMTFGEETMGRGSFIYFVDNPLFRAFWENGKLFLVNSIFFVNNENYRM